MNSILGCCKEVTDSQSITHQETLHQNFKHMNRTSCKSKAGLTYFNDHSTYKFVFSMYRTKLAIPPCKAPA